MADRKEYVCERGHETSTRWGDKPLTKCPAYVLGSPCTAEIRRVGKGSKKENAA